MVPVVSKLQITGKVKHSLLSDSSHHLIAEKSIHPRIRVVHYKGGWLVMVTLCSQEAGSEIRVLCVECLQESGFFEQSLWGKEEVGWAEREAGLQ